MRNTIYALGFFDGVHRGHQALLSACLSLAQKHGCSAGVVTFAAHPDTLVKGNTPRLINAPKDREWLLRETYHMEILLNLPFDESMRAMPWDAFLDMLRTHYDAAGFVCGADFRFGHRGCGNADALREYCNREKLPCAVVPDQILDGIRISSTYVREQLEDGDMQRQSNFWAILMCSAALWSMARPWAGSWASPLPICSCLRAWPSRNSVSTSAPASLTENGILR